MSTAFTVITLFFSILNLATVVRQGGWKVALAILGISLGVVLAGVGVFCLAHGGHS